MSFLAPGFLWALLVLLPLAAIFFLKVRPRRKQTNAFFLWQKVFEEKKASALFRRLRDLFSLLLMLLAAASIVFAMARPEFGKDDGRDLLVVVDVSASMSAGPEGSTGIDLAREEAEAIVKALNGTRRMALASLSHRLDFVSHLSDSPRDLLRSVESLSVLDVPVAGAAVRTLNQYAAGLSGEESYRVILITDGHGGLEDLDEKVEVLRLGTATGNAGLVEADFDWLPGQAGRAGFFFRVASSFEGNKAAELELRQSNSGRIARLLPLDLKPGISEAQVIEIEGAESGPWEATLHIADDFPKDNEIKVSLPDRRKIPVRIKAAEPYFFQRCVEAFESAGGLLTVAGLGTAELLISQGAPDGNETGLIFEPQGESVWWNEIGDETEVLAARAVIEDHPLLKHLDLEGLAFQGARKLTLPEGAILLAESESGVPLIYKVTRDGRTMVVVNLHPQRGDFFLSPWFPVMVHDAARHLAARNDRGNSIYASGGVLDLPDGSEVTTPSGEILKGKQIDLNERGRYELRRGSEVSSFGVALLNAGESLLNSDGPLQSAAKVAQGRPPSLWLLILALLVITIESILYHRRKLG